MTEWFDANKGQIPEIDRNIFVIDENQSLEGVVIWEYDNTINLKLPGRLWAYCDLELPKKEKDNDTLMLEEDLKWLGKSKHTTDESLRMYSCIKILAQKIKTLEEKHEN